MVITNLPWWPVVINRNPARYYFHDKDSKTIDITSFIQHASACIFWSNIPANNKIKISGYILLYPMRYNFIG